MITIVINTERELKELVRTSREKITNINGVQFGEIYPLMEVTNKHASYYDIETQCNKALIEPFHIVM